MIPISTYTLYSCTIECTKQLGRKPSKSVHKLFSQNTAAPMLHPHKMEPTTTKIRLMEKHKALFTFQKRKVGIWWGTQTITISTHRACTSLRTRDPRKPLAASKTSTADHKTRNKTNTARGLGQRMPEKKPSTVRTTTSADHSPHHHNKSTSSSSTAQQQQPSRATRSEKRARKKQQPSNRNPNQARESGNGQGTRSHSKYHLQSIVFFPEANYARAAMGRL